MNARFSERVVLCAALVTRSCSVRSVYAVDDHFDGERFFNPARVPRVGFFSMARHVLFGRDGEWPGEPVTVATPTRIELGDGEVAITHLGHASMLIRAPGFNVLTDPVWSERVGPGGWLGPERAHPPPLALHELPRIDAVVISHNHFDHLDLPTLRALAARFAPVFVVPLGDQALLESAGITGVTELDWWQHIQPASDVTITFAPAQHNSGRSPFDHDRSLWGSYVITVGGHAIYFAGDTAFADHFAAIRRRLGPIAIALLPIGAYAPRETMRAYHMDPADAVQAHIDLGAQVSLGMHYGTFQLTGEDYDAPPRELAAAVLAAGIGLRSFTAPGIGVTQVYRLTATGAGGER